MESLETVIECEENNHQGQHLSSNSDTYFFCFEKMISCCPLVLNLREGIMPMISFLAEAYIIFD